MRSSRMMPNHPTSAPRAGPRMKRLTMLRATSPPGPGAVFVEPPSARMERTTTGRRTTSFIPVSIRRAIRGTFGNPRNLRTLRRRTGSVDASAAPSIAAAGHDTESRNRADSAISAAGTIVPGPSSRQSSGLRSRTSVASIVTASLKRTIASASIASA
jgi:hypothetical protein